MAIVKVPRESGIRYKVRVRDRNGQWFPSKTFQRRVDAEAHERHLENLKAGGAQAGALIQRSQVTLLEYWQRWSEERRKTISGGWNISQVQMARDHVLPLLGHMKLGDIESSDIGRVMLSLHDKKFSAQTQLHIFNTMRKAFSDAVEYYELLDRSPVKKKDRPKLKRQERPFLKPAEARKLLVMSRTHRLGPAVWLGLLAGMRSGEIQALRVADLDFDRGIILIRAAYKAKIRVIEPFPKQGDWGRAPMPPELADFLKECVRGRQPDDFVAQSATGGMLPYRALFFGLRRLCRDVEIPEITPHEMRHSCAELYCEAGASEEDLRRLFNHKSLTAVKAYIHRTNERLQGIADRIQVRNLAVVPQQAALG